jgi:hypothetical protein
VRRGECPDDPAVAAATVEFGEDVLSGRSRIWYWIGFLVVVAWTVVWLVVDIAEGRPLRGVVLAAIFLLAVAVSSRFNPIFWRRQRVIASVEAARAVSPVQSSAVQGQREAGVVGSPNRLGNNHGQEECGSGRTVEKRRTPVQF